MVERALPDRPFSIELWDGGRIPSTAPGPAFRVRSPRALGHILRAPNELGVGRAYVTGELVVDELDASVGLLGRWKPARVGVAARLAWR